MLPTFCTQEITRIRPGTKTERGSLIFDWSAGKISKQTIKGCSVQPSATSLSQDGRVLGVSEQLIEYDGDVYTIQGEPKIWHAAANLSNIQLTLIRWEG